MGGDRDRGRCVTVFDMVAKKTLFNLDANQVEGLEISDAFLSGNYIYLRNESDNPVIDLRTNQPASKNWSLRPIHQLTNGWVLIIPGHSGDKHSTFADGNCINNYETTCTGGGPTSQGEYLARGAGRAPYSGPWF